jgi:hypothetical protein
MQVPTSIFFVAVMTPLSTTGELLKNKSLLTQN